MLKTQILQALSQELNGNAARLKTLCFLISAVISRRTVNLTHLASVYDGRDCSQASRYRRLQDFFFKFTLCLTSTARLMLSRLPKPDRGYVLAMDRTNWKFGRSHINFLVIAVVVGKVSVPVVWTLLPKKTKSGNSNGKQRTELTKKLLKVLPRENIYVLTLDREFKGSEWLKWLDKKGVPFILRITKNTVIGSYTAIELAKQRGPKSKRRREVFGFELFFASKKMKKDGRSTYLMVLSNRFFGAEALELYRLRWGIERLFGHLKRNGFDLEATHLTDRRKLETLFGIVSLAFVMSFAWGCHIKAEAAKNGKLPVALARKSHFRCGYEDLVEIFGFQIQEPPGEESFPERQVKARLADFFDWLSYPEICEISLV